MQRFLVFSDLHLNSWTYGADVTSAWNSRLDGQYKAVCAMFDHAKDNDIKSVFFCGDFFHTPSRVTSEVLQTAAKIKQKAEQCGLQVYLLEGNHDKKTEFISATSILQGGAFHVIGRNNIGTTVDGITWAGLPYTENKEVLEDFFSNVSGLNGAVILLHQGVSGVEVNSKGFTLNEVLEAEMIPAHCLHAFSGHYHTFKRVNHKLTIPGSMMQLTWGDKGEDRGFLDVVYDGTNLHMTRHITDKMICPTFVETTLSEYRLLNAVDRTERHACNIVRIIRDEDIGDEAIRAMTEKDGPAAVEIVCPASEVKATEVDVTQFDSMTDLFEEYVTHCEIDAKLADTGREIINAHR